jgi:3-methylcrotonyl-CoA carboxylase alpha subunit
VEFIADGEAGLHPGAVFFIEMNTRLQVEHPVTEAITGLDLVEWQLRIASGEALPLTQGEIGASGHAIEARIYAEDPADGFRPSAGRLWAASFPSGPGIRVDSGVEAGAVVSPLYDAMLAKVIASGADRDEALQRLTDALGRVRLAGPKTNLGFLTRVVSHPDFLAGGVSTDFADRELGHLVGAPLEPAFAAPAIRQWFTRARPPARVTRGAWARTDGFQLGGLKRSSQLDVEIDGAPVAVELAWTRGEPEILSLGGKPLHGAADAEIVWGEREAFVLSHGRQLRVSFPDPLARQADGAAGGGAVTAPLHGRVVAVDVQPGAQVVKGDSLFTLEAMKMEHAVVAPIAGTVQVVRVAPGAQVEQGAPAILIEPQAGPAGIPVE